MSLEPDRKAAAASAYRTFVRTMRTAGMCEAHSKLFHREEQAKPMLAKIEELEAMLFRTLPEPEVLHKMTEQLANAIDAYNFEEMGR